jgi:hypothetical protein
VLAVTTPWLNAKGNQLIYTERLIANESCDSSSPASAIAPFNNDRGPRPGGDRSDRGALVRERNYKKLRQYSAEVSEFSYRNVASTNDQRVVVVRKNITVERRDNVLFDEYRYLFYITNDQKMTPDEVVAKAHQRCDQENLHAQLKGEVRALHAPVNTCQLGLLGDGVARLDTQGLVRLARTSLASLDQQAQW